MTLLEKSRTLQELLFMSKRTAYRRLTEGKFTELEIHVLKQHGKYDAIIK